MILLTEIPHSFGDVSGCRIVCYVRIGTRFKLILLQSWIAGERFTEGTKVVLGSVDNDLWLFWSTTVISQRYPVGSIKFKIPTAYQIQLHLAIVLPKQKPSFCSFEFSRKVDFETGYFGQSYFVTEDRIVVAVSNHSVYIYSQDCLDGFSQLIFQ